MPTYDTHPQASIRGLGVIVDALDVRIDTLEGGGGGGSGTEAALDGGNASSIHPAAGATAVDGGTSSVT